MYGLIDPGQYKNLMELRAAFPDEHSCIDHMNKVMFDGVRKCERCGHTHFYRYKARPYIFDCKSCRKQMSPLSGTVFQDSRIPLITWFMAMYVITSFEKGVSSYRLAKELNVAQNTAWFITQRIRT